MYAEVGRKLESKCIYALFSGSDVDRFPGVLLAWPRHTSHRDRRQQLKVHSRTRDFKIVGLMEVAGQVKWFRGIFDCVNLYIRDIASKAPGARDDFQNSRPVGLRDPAKGPA